MSVQYPALGSTGPLEVFDSGGGCDAAAAAATEGVFLFFFYFAIFVFITRCATVHRAAFSSTSPPLLSSYSSPPPPPPPLQCSLPRPSYAPVPRYFALTCRNVSAESEFCAQVYLLSLVLSSPCTLILLYEKSFCSIFFFNFFCNIFYFLIAIIISPIFILFFFVHFFYFSMAIVFCIHLETFFLFPSAYTTNEMCNHLFYSFFYCGRGQDDKNKILDAMYEYFFFFIFKNLKI